ncbi:hypothetical protein J1605_021033 [Eschrichtius robustus]|uniref:Small ribosomal subunit protein eS6 n=1 Tax=Eschrichtius robustus TaxID=9764 RepID=A0AB34HK77_ESCRO|nr:hypothetical protein J1605_021033 [Eschrichtius robustus]
MICEAGKGKGAKRFYGDMPRGLVGGAVAQRPPGTSCFRFPEWSVARRSWGRWLCRELWNRGLRPTPLWSCLPAASRYSAGDSELWLLPLPVTPNGCQRLTEVDDEQKLHTFCEKHMATEVAADALGEEWKGYVF